MKNKVLSLEEVMRKLPTRKKMFTRKELATLAKEIGRLVKEMVKERQS